MKVKVIKKIVDNVNIVQIEVYDVNEADNAAFLKFSEPVIDLGGTIQGNEYPNNEKFVYSDSPHIFRKDISVPQDESETECDNWETEMINRMTTAMTTLRALFTTWVGETITNI